MLLEHPGAYRVPAIERGLLPVDQRAAADPARVRRARLPGCASPTTPVHALTEAVRAPAARRQPSVAAARLRRRAAARPPGPQLDPDRLRARAARTGAGARWARSSCSTARPGPVAVAAVGADGVPIAELLARARRAVARSRMSSGGSSAPRPGEERSRSTARAQAPVFLLLGDNERLPSALRERATPYRGGARLPLTLESWRAIDAEPLQGWISHAAKRCVAALEEGRPAPPAVLELSEIHEQPTFVLAPGHDLGMVEEFARLAGAPIGRRRRAGAATRTTGCRRSSPTRSGCRISTGSSPSTSRGWRPRR